MAFAARRSSSSHARMLSTYAASKYCGQKKASALYVTTCAGPRSNE